MTRRAIRPIDPEWFARLGQVARAIGTDSFYERLIGLLGSVIAHDSTWIIRYSRHARQDVLFTSNVPAHIVEFYLSKYWNADPFFHYWKTVARPGVIVSRQALAISSESEIYALLFQIKAHISNEMAMFFPVIGHSGVALFLVRSEGYFSPADEARARLIFPALEGLHRAHLGRLFYDLRNTTETAAREWIKLPTLIVDRAGAMVYASRSWREAEKANPAIRQMIGAMDAGAGHATKVSDGVTLRMERFDRDFPLAPGGRMYALEQRTAGIAEQPAAGSATTSQIEASLGHVGKITRRERDILLLILRGRTTGEIAQHLRISKGTIKNYRLRLYRKMNVTSERALVSLFLPFLGQPAGAGAP